MSDSWLEPNLLALTERSPAVAKAIASAPDIAVYTGLAQSRTGLDVPLYADGHGAHSLYDPLREASRWVDQIQGEVFPVFIGLGGGYRVREFLRRNPFSSCAVVEAGTSALRSLFSLVDLTDLLRDERVSLIPSPESENLREGLTGFYLPALQGGITVIPPGGTWPTPQDPLLTRFGETLAEALGGITADYSVQAHFGRLWLRNFWANIKEASRGFDLPPLDRTRTALIAAAGPSLERAVREIRERRDEYCVFATDTAYGTLVSLGILPEFLVSIDAQYLSAYHGSGGIRRETVTALELCGNPELGRRARSFGGRVLYFSGNHPLSRLASSRFALPEADTSSGTVTLAAEALARSLGYASILTLGADFAYTGGKPYARGTYLADRFGCTSKRLSPQEGAYTALMFRTETRRSLSPAGDITYHTDLLDSYAAARGRFNSGISPFPPAVAPFDWKSLADEIICDLSASMESPLRAKRELMPLLPFMAWYRRRVGGTAREAIELALTLIGGYTTTP